MGLVLFQVLNGLGLGVIYFLLTIGLSIIFGLLGFVNFAHGAFYAMAAYMTYGLTAAGVSFWWCILLVPPLAALVGCVLEQGVLRWTYERSHAAQIIVTFGFVLVIQETLTWLFGTRALNVEVPDALSGVVQVGTFFYPQYRLFTMAVGLVVAIGLYFLIRHTKFGAIIRASSESKGDVLILGINARLVYALAFAAGIAVAGLGGVLAAPLRGVDPTMGAEVLGIAFVVVVLGGVGSFAGTFLAAMLVGLAQSLMGMVWPAAANLAIYIAMAVVIMFRPYGLLGKAA